MKFKLLFTLAGAMAIASSHAAIVFTENFNYADGSIVTNSAGVWTNNSGTAGQSDTVAGALNVVASESEDIKASFPGAAVTTGVMTATFTVNFSALPTSAGTYFAHFIGNTNSFTARLYATTTGAASGFRLGIANATGTTANAVFIAEDLSLATAYTITLAVDLDTNVSTLAIAGVAGGAAVAATDTPVDQSVFGFGFRQAAGIGNMTVDNLSVDYTTTIPEPASALLGALGFMGLLRRRR